MPDNSVVFTVSANTKPASKALLDLQKELQNVSSVKSVDKQTVKQQRELLKAQKAVNEAVSQYQNKFKLYSANAKQVENLTKALEDQREKTLKAAEAYDDFTAKKEAGETGLTPKGEYWKERKLRENVKAELQREAQLRESLENYQKRVNDLDEYSEQMLRHILGDENEIVKDEGSVLGYKIQQRSVTEEALTAESGLENTAKQTSNAYAETAENAKKAGDAISDTAKKASTGTADKQDFSTKDAKADLLDLKATVIAVKADVSTIGDSMRLDPATNNIAELIRRYNELKAAKKSIEALGMPKEADSTYATILRLLSEITRQINDYKKSLSETTTETSKLSAEGKSVGKSISQGMKVAKSGLNGIKSVLSSVRKGFNHIAKASNKASSSFDGMSRGMKSNFKHLISNITKYVFGFRSLFFLVRRLRKYLVEGIQDLVRYEKAIGESKALNSTNQAITQLKTSLQYLQHAWSAAFAPIINAVTPWLTQLIDMLARAGNTVAKFIGVLTGQKVVYNAIKTPAKDYADSLDKAGNSAGKAAKKQKQLNDRIAAFDDLIILGKDKDNDTNGNGSGSGGNDEDKIDYSKMFKKVKAVSKLATMIKDAIKNGFDFTEVGAYISNGLYNALHNINWPNIKKQAENIGYGIGTFISGFFKDDKIWTEVGRTIAQGINTATKFVSGFLKGTKNLDLGGGLAKLINKFFTTVSWKDINKNIREFVRQLVTNLANFLNGINWKEIDKAVQGFGQTIGYAISQTLGNPELMKSIGEAIGHLLNDFIIAWNEIVKSTSGDDIGKAIYDFVAGAIKNIEWDKVAQNMSSSLILILDAISKFSEELAKDDKFQKALEEFVTNLDLDGIFAALGKNISSSTVAANSIGSAIAEVLDREEVSQRVGSAIGSLIANLDAEQMLESTITFIGKLLESALTDPLLIQKIGKSAADTLAENIAKWFVDSGANEKSGGEIALSILVGIGKAIISLWKNTSPFYQIITSFDEQFSPSVFETRGSALIDNLKDGIESKIGDIVDKFNGLKSDLEENWDNLKESATTKWDNIKSTIVTKAGEIKSSAMEKFNLFKDEVARVWSSISGTAYAKWQNIKKVLVDAINGIKDALKTPINGLISIIESMINKVIGGLNSMFSKLNSLPDFKITNPFNGKEYNLKLNMPTLKNVSIPRLAQGAVIPPNREFMAVLGDQSHGTNVEAPLDTIKQAVAEVLANNGNAEVIQLLQQLIGVVESKNLTIGDKEIAKANARYTNQQRLIRGTSF